MPRQQTVNTNLLTGWLLLFTYVIKLYWIWKQDQWRKRYVFLQDIFVFQSFYFYLLSTLKEGKGASQVCKVSGNDKYYGKKIDIFKETKDSPICFYEQKSYNNWLW